MYMLYYLTHDFYNFYAKTYLNKVVLVRLFPAQNCCLAGVPEVKESDPALSHAQKIGSLRFAPTAYIGCQ